MPLATSGSDSVGVVDFDCDCFNVNDSDPIVDGSTSIINNDNYSNNNNSKNTINNNNNVVNDLPSLISSLPRSQQEQEQEQEQEREEEEEQEQEHELQNNDTIDRSYDNVQSSLGLVPHKNINTDNDNDPMEMKKAPTNYDDDKKKLHSGVNEVHNMNQPVVRTVTTTFGLWWNQFWTLLHKNFMIRKKTTFATLIEIISPTLMMLILVLAYNLSTVYDEPAAMYHTTNVTLNGELLQTWSTGTTPTTTSTTTTTMNNTQQQRQLQRHVDNFIVQQQPFNLNKYANSKPQKEQYIRHYYQQQTKTPVTFNGWKVWLKEQVKHIFDNNNYDNNHHHHDNHQEKHVGEHMNLQQQYLRHITVNRNMQEVGTVTYTNSTTTADNETEGTTDEEQGGGYELLDNAYNQINSLLMNPTSIPTLRQYIEFSNTIKSVVNVTALPDVFRLTSYGRSWGNILTLGTLHLSPSTNIRTNEFWLYLNQTYPDIMKGMDGNSTTDNNTTQPLVTVRVHETEQAALEYIDKYNAIEQTWALIDFTTWPLEDEKSVDSHNLLDAAIISPSYKIRMNYTTIPNTAEIIDFVTIGLNTDYQQYYLSGFLTLQQTVNEFAFIQQDQHQQRNSQSDEWMDNTGNGTCINLLRTYKNNDDRPNVYSMPMPTAEYSQNTFYLAVGFLLGFTIVMAYLYPFARLIKNLVEEKETKMKEILYIAGVYETAHWFSWLVFAMILFMIISVLVTFTLSINVFRNSNSLYMYLWFGAFSTSSVGLCFVTSAFFTKSKLAAIIGPIALFATVLPRYLFFGFNRYEAVLAKKWASLLPATAFAFGADIVADYEYSGVGIQHWNASDGSYSFNTSLGFLIFDTLLYVFLGWYLDQIVPRQYGTARPFYFIASPVYWFPSFFRAYSNKNSEMMSTTAPFTAVNEVNQIKDDDKGNENTIAPDTSYHEIGHDETLVPWVKVQNLSKHYNKNLAPAVDNLNVTFYKDQVTALLGHNGAGKSSFLGMLTGLLTPTSGDCFIGGTSIRSDTFHARQMIGFCPQDNILYDRLTVIEHIRFFLRLKGMTSSYDVVKSLAIEVGLADFLHVRSGALSGGNKRKLCLAIALAGDSQQTLLVLDEPTSGMDPSSRRACWECLRRKRLGRVIILVSHTMSEADLLADRVAIMKEGKVQASGSPLFLKDRFGLGYNLTVVIENEAGGKVCNEIGDSQCEKLLTFLREYIPTVKITRIFGKEVTFRLPKGCEHTFQAAFEAIELSRKEFEIGAFGIENSSLEEVFLLLADDAGEEDAEDTCPAVNSSDELPNNNAAMVSQCSNSISPIQDDEPEFVRMSWISQIGLMYWKRFIIQKRDGIGFFFSVVVPVIVVALVLLILTIDIPIVGPSMEMSPATLLNSVSVESDFLMGGGASYNETESVNDTVASQAQELESFQKLLYPMLVSIHKETILTSEEMSQYLLETINDNKHNTRYGAFVFQDLLETSYQVEWQNMQEEIPVLLNSSEAKDWVAAQSIDSMKSIITTLLGASSNQSNVDPATTEALASGLVSGIIPLESLNAFIPTESETYDNEIASTVSILHNASSPHSVAIFNKAYMDFLFKSCSPQKLVSTINHPLPLTTEQALEIKAVLSILASLFLLIPFCLFPGAFTIFLVKEQACKSKHLQFVSGCSVSAYWIGGYIWDISLYLILVVLVMLVFLMYGNDSAEAFVGSRESFLCTLALILGYGLSVLPFSYIVARKFSNHGSAQIAVIGTNFFTGFVAVNAYFIMKSIENIEHIADALAPLFRTWPAYNFGDGLIRLSNSFWEREGLGRDKQPFDWAVAGKPLALLYGLILPYLILLLLLEDGISGYYIDRLRKSASYFWHTIQLSWYKVRYENEKLVIDGDGDCWIYAQDRDVLQERALLLDKKEEMIQSAPVVFHNLWKVYFPPGSGPISTALGYPRRILRSLLCNWKESKTTTAEMETDETKFSRPKRAVRGLTVSVGKGETFVLLGPNGCGKTTSIGILTGDIAPTYGQVFVNGNDVTGNDLLGIVEARKQMGLCPQVDPLLENMTGRETLTFFARVRGIPWGRIEHEVCQLMDQLTLTPHADKACQTYSGGNKRKLSLGIALIGRPSVLLIDESSSGVDPVAQRQIWNLISEISVGRSVLLTTHSMDEAQALATKTAVMAAGQLLCLGSVQHLKSQYLGGYTIDVYLHDDPCDIFYHNTDVIGGTFIGDSTDKRYVAVNELLQNILPGTILTEHHGRFVRFEIPGKSRFPTVHNGEIENDIDVDSSKQQEQPSSASSSTSVAPISLGEAFGRLERLKSNNTATRGFGQLRVENYSVKQCSLEQVFVKLIASPSTTSTTSTSSTTATLHLTEASPKS